MNLATKITHESKALPGVSFTVRRLNQFQRAKVDMGILDSRARISELARKAEALGEPADAPPSIERVKLHCEMEIESTLNVKPAYIRAGLVSVDGLEIDSRAPTADDLIEAGHDGLLDEIYAACQESAGLTGEQQKNSQSPTTSDAAAPAGETNTTATAASE